MKTTKASLAKEFSNETGVPEYIAKKHVSQILKLLAKEIMATEKVMISGLGTFSKKEGRVDFSPSKKIKINEGRIFDATKRIK